MTPKNDKKFNFWGSLALVIFSIAFLIASFLIQDISTAMWYDSPKLFPLVIGFCLLLFCLIYRWQNRDGWAITSEDIKGIKTYLKSLSFLRLVVSIALLALYVFVLLGLRIGTFQLPYEAATFLYLFLTMCYFRPKGYAIWKILLVSAVLSVAIGYGFSHFAKIPLP